MLHKVAPIGSAMTPNQWSKGKAQEVPTRLIAKTIALLILPLCTMETPAFHQLLNFFAPWYNLPSQ